MERMEQTVSSLQGKMVESEERVQDEITRQLASIERSISSVNERLEDSEKRQEDSANQAIIQRLDRLEQRKTDDSVQQALQSFSQRFDSADNKTNDLLDQIKSALAENSKRIERLETSKGKPAAEAHDDFGLPPFPDAPPFPSAHDGAGPEAPPIPDIFAAPPTPQADAGAPPEDRKSTRLNSSHVSESRMPSSA